MPILGIGVDIVHVPRIARVLRRAYAPRFAKRILSLKEQQQWEALDSSGASREERIRFLAVRWCVKEAAYKAMYPTIIPTWKDLTYTSLSKTAKPQLTYHPQAGVTEVTNVDAIHVSVSHDGEYIMSQVLVEGTQRLKFDP